MTSICGSWGLRTKCDFTHKVWRCTHHEWLCRLSGDLGLFGRGKYWISAVPAEVCLLRGCYRRRTEMQSWKSCKSEEARGHSLSLGAGRSGCTSNASPTCFSALMRSRRMPYQRCSSYYHFWRGRDAIQYRRKTGNTWKNECNLGELCGAW